MDMQDYYGDNPGDFWHKNESMWRSDGMESAGLENDDFSDYIHYDQGRFRRGGGFGMNGPTQFYGPHGPPAPSGSRYTWGRGFGPGGPPKQNRQYTREYKPIGFLIRCGLPKQVLKGLPKGLLRLMEPQYCGVCAMEFDNFTTSRLHYISKNHAKNQKKWLSQQVAVGALRPGQVPLKSRDLYCELCDVHITSTAHAESHYSGRPHRAIVEGRKNPKNPYLLQKGMQDRVDQLIRREKKNLKPLEETEISKEAKQEPKLAQPDLYCDICKTSMTCTEQMTMHMNGKKHLAKEKQHILKMMKGEASADKPADNVNTNKEKPVDNVDANKEKPADNVDANKDGEAVDDAVKDEDSTEKEDQDDDDYGWGNGSGNWDDDPQ